MVRTGEVNQSMCSASISLAIIGYFIVDVRVTTLFMLLVFLCPGAQIKDGFEAVLREQDC